MTSQVPGSDNSKDTKPSGDHSSRPDTTGFGLVASGNPDQIMTATNVQSMLNTQVALLQQILTSFSESHASTTRQVLYSFAEASRRTTSLEKTVTNLVATTASATTVTDIASELQSLRLASANQAKVVSLEQDVTDLRAAFPTRKRLNIPKITDVSKISLPPRPTFQLSSHTVKLKDLTNSLNNIKYESDSINSIKHTYALIRQAIDIGCNTSYLMPDIENLTEVPDFFTELVPPQTRFFYQPVLGSYKTLSNSLLTFHLRPTTVSDSAPQVAMAINGIKASSDGFVYLATVLHKLLPQFGGPPLKLIDELKNLTINDG